MAECVVSGIVEDLTGKIIVNGTLRFTRTTDVFVFDGTIRQPSTVTARTNGSGFVSVRLVPGVYRVSIQSPGAQKSFNIAVPIAAAANIADIVTPTPEEIVIIAPLVDQARASKDAAEVAATAAEASANRVDLGALDQAVEDSLSARDLARAWAENVEDNPVVPGGFSALHWSAKASASSALASGERSSAEAARIGAEAARDASFTNATVYPDIATGRAAVADGAQFTVVATGATEAIRYRRDTSTTQTELARYPTTSLVNEIGARVPAPFNVGPLPAESGYLWGILDAGNRLGFGLTTDAKLNFVPADGVPRIPPADVSISNINPETGYLHVIAGANDTVGYGLRTDGTFYARLAEDCPVPSWASGGGLAGLLPTADIACWGDSMTIGSGATTGATRYPQSLGAALGRSVANLGIGGQGSAQIAGRQGGLPVTVTVSGNEIPASGAVSVTAISPAILNGGSSAAALSQTGTLAGIPGTLSKTGFPAVYTFTRATAGDVTACPAGSLFVSDQAAQFRASMVVIWAGRNDTRGGDAATQRSRIRATRDNILSMVSFLSPLVKRVLVLPIFNGRAVAVGGGAYEPSGSAAYNEIMLVNDTLRRTFGDSLIGDLRTYMVRDAIYDAGLTPTADDLSDMAADCIPRALFSDDIHLNDSGYPQVGNYVARYIRAKGW